MRGKSVKQRSDFSFGSEIALSIALLRYFESRLHSLQDLFRIIGLIWSSLLQLRVLLFPGFVPLNSSRQVECVRSEKSIDLFLELWDISLVESCLEDLGGEDHHSLVEVPVGFLIGKD